MLGVVLEVDLLHCSLGILIKFQFYEVEIGLGQENNVNSAFWGYEPPHLQDSQ